MLLKELIYYSGLFIFITVALIFIAGCSFKLPKNNAQPNYALAPDTQGKLGQALTNLAQEYPDLTGIKPITNGADAFAVRMFLADLAHSSIDVQYYIWRNDLTGYLLLDRLKQAADRGVKVRLLLDDHGTAHLDDTLYSLQQHPNIEIRLWNPFNLRNFKKLSFTFDFARLNRRMHNKAFTVDGHASVLGGRNVGDEYFSTGATPFSVDLDVLAVGAVVPKINQDFDLYWNSPSAYTVEQLIKPKPKAQPLEEILGCYSHTQQLAEYIQVLQNTEIVDRLASSELSMHWVPVKLVSDNPAKGQGALPREKLLGGILLEAVGHIEERFDGVSPYFVPGKEGALALNSLVAQGVQVRMLTNSLEATNVLPVHAGYTKWRNKMLKGGVELYEMRSLEGADQVSKRLGIIGSSGSSLHAKTFAVDGKRIFVGSFNFDPRSDQLNTEMGLLISSPELAELLHASFDSGLFNTSVQVKKEGRHLTWHLPNQPDAPPLTKEPGSSFWRNVGLKVLGWLPLEHLL